MEDTECAHGAATRQMVEANTGDIGEIKADIKEIKEKLLGRPTWAVLYIITFLSSLCMLLIGIVLSGK